MRTRTGSWILGLAIALTANVDAGSVRFVDDDAPLGGDGATWNTAYRYLQDALIDAGAGGVSEIRVAQGTYAPDQDEGGNVTPGDREATFQLVSGLTVRGGYAGVTSPADPDARDVNMYVTIVTGDLLGNDVPDDFPEGGSFDDNSYHVWTALFAQGAALDGFTVDGGNPYYPSEADGGGLRSVESDIMLHSCQFVANYADGDGAAIHATSSELTLALCTFTGNFARRNGGGIYLDGGSGVWSHCMFSDNTALDLKGGAAFVTSADLLLNGCEFITNDCQGFDSGGGALRCEQESMIEINACSFGGNFVFQGPGGAIYASGGTLTISGSEFISNRQQVGNGGAIHHHNGIGSSICTSSFVNNKAGDKGGAIWETVSGSFESIEACVFDGNRAFFGTGGAIMGGQLDINDCVFVGNESKGDDDGDGGGGALHLSGGSSVMRNCTLLHNYVDTPYSDDADGGGGAILGSGLTLINCVLMHNASAEDGGAINGGNLTLINCTLVSNTAEDSIGGGIYSLGSVSLTNCVLWGNADDVEINESTQINAGTVDVNYTCVQGWTGKFGGVGNIGDDPLLADPDADDVHLLPGSPCIDAGDNEALLGPTGIYTDLDGNPRFVDDPDTTDTGNGTPPIVDMGAYEFQIAACLADVTGSDGIVDAADLAIILGNWGPVPPGDPIADLNGDGSVGPADLAIVLGNWGPCP